MRNLAVSKTKLVWMAMLFVCSFSEMAIAGVTCTNPGWQTKCEIEIDFGSISKCSGWGYESVSAPIGNCDISEDECLAKVGRYTKKPLVLNTECGKRELMAKEIEYRFIDRPAGKQQSGKIKISTYSDQ